jgi:hypothetical protein
VVIKIKEFNKEEQQIIDNYLNSGKHDQTLKNAQMLAMIHRLLKKIEGSEKDE